MHRYFAFNSPIYFNLGLQENPQSSACFILDVQDNMDSITELGKLEAQIFKKGSGTGSNLSTLRSCKEPVTGGGTASGPISFLKAHDTLAGVVKSGGTLRRSAKLACLNINHPDIEDFIDCKLFEEEKLAVLRKAGIKNRPGYDLADEVYFQNTNLSVRIPDEFMKRVIQDRTWDTKFVKTKETCKTYKAKDLLRASKLSPLGMKNKHVEKNTKKIEDGKYLSPILLVRNPQGLIVADGYHRLCSIYLYNEDSIIKCKIV